MRTAVNNPNPTLKSKIDPLLSYSAHNPSIPRAMPRILLLIFLSFLSPWQEKGIAFAFGFSFCTRNPLLVQNEILFPLSLLSRGFSLFFSLRSCWGPWLCFVRGQISSSQSFPWILRMLFLSVLGPPVALLIGCISGEWDGYHHWLNGHEFEQTLGDGEGQGSLACCSPRGRKESDIQWLNNNNNRRLKKDEEQGKLEMLGLS